MDETTGESLTALAHRGARRVFSAQTARALRELLASQAPELRLLEAAAAVLPAEKQSRLADARAIWALGNLLDLMRELELLPDEGEE